MDETRKEVGPADGDSGRHRVPSPVMEATIAQKRGSYCSMSDYQRAATFENQKNAAFT